MFLLLGVLLVGLLFWVTPPVVYAATITVNTTDDELTNDGDCSLREAIQAANTDSQVDNCGPGSGDDEIILPAGTYVLAISGTNEDNNASGDLDIKSNLTIKGAGADVTIIDGNQIDRVLHVHYGAIVTINDVKITNGKTPDGANPGDSGEDGGGIYNEGTLTLNDCIVTGNATGNGNGDSVYGGDGGYGGGIANIGTLTVNRCTISNNYTGNGNGNDGYGGDGGGIYNEGTLTLNDSTVSGNQTGNGDLATTGNGGFGGGISNAGSLTMNRCTISGNVTGDGGGTGGDGGGIYNWSGADLTLNNCTLTNNSVGRGGVAADDGLGGGIYDEGGQVQIKNTIIAGNTDPSSRAPDCDYDDLNSVITSQDYNIIGNDTGCNFPAGTHDQVGVDPMLGTLADNGGPTQTHALSAGSPAIDAIPTTSGNCTAGEKDQRSALRASGDNAGGLACDIGAYEVSNTFQQDITGPDTYILHKTKIQVTTQGTLSQLTVLYVPSNHPNAPTAIQTGQYWTFTPNSDASGFTISMTLPFAQTPDQNDRVCRYTGVGQDWDCAADSFDTTNKTITRSGITQFSDWAVGDDVDVPTVITLNALNGRVIHTASWAWGLAAFSAAWGAWAWLTWRRSSGDLLTDIAHKRA
ncbi:MAG TPA: CSLREA domain-containing protein [Caldilineae bacterium]|nr:CSLREA domain-containing protein [Caldilineae bacterium]